jgi:hypothetical protein
MVNETFSLIPNGILIFDLISKQIIFANKEMMDILGAES